MEMGREEERKNMDDRVKGGNEIGEMQQRQRGE